MSETTSIYNALDLFAGAGGLSEGLKRANFDPLVAVEINKFASDTYELNHPNTHILRKNIRDIKATDIQKVLGSRELHLLAGCPPCQGFSSVRRLNRSTHVDDERNDLLGEYVRLVKALKPFTFMLENVPALINFQMFSEALIDLKESGYKWIDVKVVNVKDYGVPQRRRRLVMVGSRLNPIEVALGTGVNKTVRETIEHLERPEDSKDCLHKIFPNHTETVKERIRITPKNGGSWKDLPVEYRLKCHESANVGFNDVYGRLRWDDQSSTITGGCLNPSKGRFLHPEQNRCISAREAALLQTFPLTYKFPTDIPRSSLSLMIGNALPPDFSFIQSENLYEHLRANLTSNS